MITKAHYRIIKSLLQDERFDILLQFAHELMAKWKDESVKASTEFDTLWNLSYKEGKIDGVMGFLNALEKGVIDEI